MPGYFDDAVTKQVDCWVDISISWQKRLLIDVAIWRNRGKMFVNRWSRSIEVRHRCFRLILKHETIIEWKSAPKNSLLCFLSLGDWSLFLVYTDLLRHDIRMIKHDTEYQIGPFTCQEGCCCYRFIDPLCTDWKAARTDRLSVTYQDLFLSRIWMSCSVWLIWIKRTHPV